MRIITSLAAAFPGGFPEHPAVVVPPAVDLPAIEFLLYRTGSLLVGQRKLRTVRLVRYRSSVNILSNRAYDFARLLPAICMAYVLLHTSTGDGQLAEAPCSAKRR